MKLNVLSKKKTLIAVAVCLFAFALHYYITQNNENGEQQQPYNGNDCKDFFQRVHFRRDATLPTAEIIFGKDHIVTVSSMIVTHVEAYTTPLNAIYQSSHSDIHTFFQKQWKPVDFHAFVVSTTNNGLYVSVKKQRDGIYIEKSNKIDILKYFFRKDSRKHPVLKKDSYDSNYPVDKLLKIVEVETDGYDVVTNSCQHFAERIFNKVAQTKSLKFQSPLEFFSNYSSRACSVLIVLFVVH